MKILVFAIFIALSSIATLAQPAYDKLPRVLESGLDEELREYVLENPNAGILELVALANRKFAEKGVDFYVDPCDMKSTATNIEFPAEHGGDVFHAYRATDTTGRSVRFIARQPGDAPCGCWLALPVRSITTRQLALVVRNSNDLMIRPPKSFLFEEAELVDAKLRKTIRTWITPFGGGPPDGISEDGTKIYMKIADTPISLEIAQNGNLRFVATGSPGIITTFRDLKNFRKDPANAYLGYRRFTSGKRSYTVEFSHVCT